jgi:hypothetical protein
MLILEWKVWGYARLGCYMDGQVATWPAGGHSFSAYPPIVCGEGVLMEFVPRSHPGARGESAAKPSA